MADARACDSVTAEIVPHYRPEAWLALATLNGPPVVLSPRFRSWRIGFNRSSVADNSDVDIVVGDGPNCRIESNSISHSMHHGFAGLQIGFFNGSGNHPGSNYAGNTVTAAANKLAFGVMVGNHPWDVTTWINGHNVNNNSSSGAVANLAIDGSNSGSVQSNGWSGAQGTYGFNCPYSADYTAYDYGSTSFQNGWISRWYHNGACGS